MSIWANTTLTDDKTESWWTSDLQRFWKVRYSLKSLTFQTLESRVTLESSLAWRVTCMTVECLCTQIKNWFPPPNQLSTWLPFSLFLWGLKYLLFWGWKDCSSTLRGWADYRFYSAQRKWLVNSFDGILVVSSHTRHCQY